MFVEALENRQFLSAGDLVEPMARRSSVANAANLWFDGRKARVALTTASGKSANIQAGRATWVVMHGWTNDLASTRRLAGALDRTSRKDQVLILDWSKAAGSTDVVSATMRVPTVSQWAARTLAARGLSGGHLHLVGHSLGAYMADQVARRTSGGVNRIIALDPATPDVEGFDLSGTNFAGRSRFSVAFVGSSFASQSAAFSADETIRMNVGDFDSIISHGAVPDLFASMTLRSVSSKPGKVCPLFSVTRLTSSARPKWKQNAFSGGYEAVLAGRATSDHYQPTGLTYVPRKASQSVTLKA
jgi:pimeloyl-ACP methyl ester carboxylesterase